ncbi:MAG: hypothetical protein WC712_08285 [Candidatus Brocadiia bacterium]
MRIKRHLVNTSSIGMTSVVFIVLAVFYGASSSAPAEQAGLPDSFQIGPVRMVLIPATKQALPPLVDGFADFDAEPLIVDVPAFYLAEGQVVPDDFPTFKNRYALDLLEVRENLPGSLRFTQLERALFVEYLNTEVPAEVAPAPGAFALPSIAQLFAAAFRGNRYTLDTPIPEWLDNKLVSVADRFTGSDPIGKRVPTYGDPPKFEPHRDPLLIRRIDDLHPMQSWPDIRLKNRYIISRLGASVIDPLAYATPLNIGTARGGILICFVPYQKEGASPAHFAEQVEPGLPSIPAKFADENAILTTYRALLAAPHWNGAPDPRRLLVAAIADLAYDRAGAATRGTPVDFFTVDEFKRRCLPGLDDLLSKAAADDAELRLAVELVVQGVAYGFFNGRPREKYLGIQTTIREFVGKYRLGDGKGEINSPLLRQALATAVVGLNHDAPNYAAYKVQAGGQGIFLLENLDGEVRRRAEGESDMDFNFAFPVNPLVMRGVPDEGREISISSDWHAFVVTGGGVSSWLVYRNLVPFGYNEKPMDEFPFLFRYFRGPAFLQRYYGQCVFDAPPFEDHVVPLPRVSSEEGRVYLATMFADARAIGIEQKFVFSRDVFKLIDPRSPAHSPIVRLAVQSDRVGVPLTPWYLDHMTEADRKEFARYQEYIDNSHADLAASYPRTWRVNCIAKGTWRDSTSLIRLPNYGTQPQFSLVFLPQEWTVVAARVGLEVALFDYNLMGIGDRRLIFGGFTPPDPD